MAAIAMHLIAAKQYLSKVAEEIFMPGQQDEMLVEQLYACRLKQLLMLCPSDSATTYLSALRDDDASSVWATISTKSKITAA